MLFCCAPQVDQHIEAINIVCRGQEDVVTAGQLARKAVKPKKITLLGRDTDSSLAAMAALLANGQHHPLFQRVQWLRFEGRIPEDLPQVSESCLSNGICAILTPHCRVHESAVLVRPTVMCVICIVDEMLCRTSLCLCPS
jgi:hypothetical protein